MRDLPSSNTDPSAAPIKAPSAVSNLGKRLGSVRPLLQGKTGNRRASCLKGQNGRAGEGGNQAQSARGERGTLYGQSCTASNPLASASVWAGVMRPVWTIV
jgi:hypothetical protein